MADEIEFEILPDGRARATTDPISMANHVTAENVLNYIARLTGVPTEKKQRQDVKKGEHHHHSHQKGKS